MKISLKTEYWKKEDIEFYKRKLSESTDLYIIVFIWSIFTIYMKFWWVPLIILNSIILLYFLIRRATYIKYTKESNKEDKHESN